MHTPVSLAVYNPIRLSDENFLKGFVARQDLADRLLSRLDDITLDNRAHHHLLLGQRGMGKTSMLRRIELGIKSSPKLEEKILPISFREEQYNVHNLRTLWLNCLDALADSYEKSGENLKANKVDLEISRLQTLKQDKDGEEALSCFIDFCSKENRRPLLLIDNLDIILSGIKDDQWSFRRVLQKNGGIIVIGASSTYLEALSNKDAAFYDFFQVTLLKKLTPKELTKCLTKLAKLRGKEGEGVIQVLNSDSSRIKTIFNLTGGNPRTLTLLYMLLEMDSSGDVFSDLERLLDQVTALYKARVEDLSPQSRVVLDALALNWDPINAAGLGASSGLSTSSVSSHLDRLVRDGIVEKVSISTSSRNAYQLSERFFNIWYLMRHAQRRQRARLKWLTGFLKSFYDQVELEKKAESFFGKNNKFTPALTDYYLALGDAIENRSWRHLIGHEVLKSKGIELPLNEDNSVAAEGMETCETVDEWLMLAELLDSMERTSEAERCYQKITELEPDDPMAWTMMGSYFDDTERLDEAVTAYKKSISISETDNISWLLLADALTKLDASPEEILEAYEKALSYSKVSEDDELSQEVLNRIGSIYLYDFDDPESSKPFFNRTLDLNNKNLEAIVKSGICHSSLMEIEMAEEKFLHAIELQPEHPHAWGVLGDLYCNIEDKEKEAEEAYVAAIKYDPEWPNPRQALGNLFLSMDKLEDAEKLYNEVIELAPDYGSAWNKIGTLKLFKHDDTEAALEAFNRASSTNPENSIYSINIKLVEFLKDNMGHFIEEDYAELLEWFCECGAAFIKAIRAIQEDDFGTAMEQFRLGLESDHAVTYSPHGALFTLFAKQLRAKQYGSKALSYFEDSGLKEKYWPIHTALEAFFSSKEKLRDVNPEVRETAEVIYSWLDGTSIPSLG